MLEIRKNIELLNTKAGFLGKKIDKSLSYLLKEKQKIHHKRNHKRLKTQRKKVS